MKLNNNFSLTGWMQGDPGIWMVFVLFCMISLVEVYSASSTMSFGAKSSYWEPIVYHGGYWAAGIVLTWLSSRIPCNKYKILGTGGFFVAIALQIIALFSGKINGAGRWIRLGFITFQPSELTKLALITFVAFIYASSRDEKGVRNIAVKIVAVALTIVMILIAPENLSTAGIIFMIIFGMSFYAQVRAKILAIVAAGLIAIGVSGLAFAYSIPEHTLQEWSQSDGKFLHRLPTWVHRITDKNELPADPKDYDITDNIQVTHARIAVATSHGIGKGPGKSRQRDYLPQAYSDFIYAIIIEEMGLAGGVAVMFLYFFFMWRCMKIASRCKSYFPSFLVMGLALMIVMQALVNMAVASGAFPVTGQPLPLISRGGTSTLVNCICVGMILSVSRTAKKVDDTDSKVK